MKFRYSSVWALSLVALASCTPVQDIYDEIDAENAQNVKTKDEYVLTESDYTSISKAAEKNATTDEEIALAKAVKTQMALNEFATADKYVPAIISSTFGSYGDGSSVGVTYNYSGENTELEKKYLAIETYKVSAADYASLWGEDSPVRFFAPTHSADASIPALLSANIADSQEGDMVLVDYLSDDKDPEFTGATLLGEDFESATANGNITSSDNWTIVNHVGSLNWVAKSYSGNLYAQNSAYKYADGEADTWMISKAVSVASANFTFKFDLKYGNYNADCFQVLISDKFDGSTITESDWTNVLPSMSGIDNVEKPASGYASNFATLSLSLAQYVGKNIYIAFRYVGEGPSTKTTTVQVDNISVSNLVLSSNEKAQNALYQFNGTDWVKLTPTDALVITPEQYDSMGSNIGKNDNFSSSYPAENYLPALLKSVYPYAQDGDSKAVIYKYYTGSATVAMAKQYNYSDGAWTLNSNIEVREKQTFLKGNGQWFFDPTVVVTVTADMYQYLVDKVTEEHPTYLDSKYSTNTEYWYGGASYYKNFNITLVKRRSNDPDGKLTGLDDDAAKEYVVNMMAEGCKEILSHYYPDAVSEVNGIQQKYKVVALAYDGSYYTYTILFKSLGKGVFELENISYELK